MHATLLTFLLAISAQVPCANCQTQTTIVGEDCGPADCHQCEVQTGRGLWGWLPGCCGPMPQTCYAPRFGCYPGNSRHMHRYPAFHGYYYRQPYNYRHTFDYPWHATPHEPQPFYSYRGATLPSDEPLPTPIPQPVGLPLDSIPSAPGAP